MNILISFFFGILSCTDKMICLVNFEPFSCIGRMICLVLCAFLVYFGCLAVFVGIQQCYVRIFDNSYTIF